MSPAGRAARAGRTLLVALLVGAVIIVAIVIAYVAGRSASRPAAAPEIGTSAPPLATGDSAAADVAPTGCAGGTARDNAMLLQAQSTAPHSTYGAVEVAAAFFRWAYRFPYPTKGQATEVGRAVVSPDAPARFRAIAASYAGASDITDGQVAEGTPFELSTVNGVWLVTADSTSDRVTVGMSGPLVVDGAISATKSAATSLTLVWGDSRWRVLSQQKPDVSALSAGGTQFTAGC